MVSDKSKGWKNISDTRVQAHPVILTLPSVALMSNVSNSLCRFRTTTLMQSLFVRKPSSTLCSFLSVFRCFKRGKCGSVHPHKILALLHQQTGLLVLYEPCELWFHQKNMKHKKTTTGGQGNLFVFIAFIKISIWGDLMFFIRHQAEVSSSVEPRSCSYSAQRNVYFFPADIDCTHMEEFPYNTLPIQ